ncbi:ABC transporter permease [Candidatus Desulfarcum epimagneticum]|uniref:ABC transporter permease n=1 Tax=uncultured Desulfobacteraceae bacterium TaxID=218296 RepID=A0A484HJC9_9BACT|nr:ABC transporter permease [uncultured Desulfobacteraceae bacterium]
MDISPAMLFSGVLAVAAPIVLAVLGETLTEKSGVINLSIDGVILLTAMVAFATAYETGSVAAGFVSAAAVGGLCALVVAVFSVYLGRSQTAVGFALTLMARDLAYFLGNPYAGVRGPQAETAPIWLLRDIPFFGEAFFSHSVPVYMGFFLTFLLWFFIYKTPAGLSLRSVGERPEASYARGLSPRPIRMLCVVCGGIFTGLAGAAFSLSVKPGWGRPQGAEGTGWIALALVIFGGWHPVRAVLGACFFSFLQIAGIYFQGWFPSIPAQALQIAPFPLMIFALLIMDFAQKESVLDWAGKRRLAKSVLKIFSGRPPAALGKPYKPD